MFKLNKKILSLLLALLLIVTSAFMVMNASATSQSMTNNIFNGKTPKYVFLFIGDGMSYPQFNSAEIYKGKEYYEDKYVGIRKLNFSNFPVAGASSTFDATSFCPDSASTATSISTGYKTNSGVINMDITKQIKFKTIAEMAKDKGYKIGIITSVSLDHATPAAFYAHQPSRGNTYEIAVELANSNFDFFGGGGITNLTGKNKDQKDALEIAKENGYKIVTQKSDILGLNNKSGKVIAMNSVLDSAKALPYEIDRAQDDLSLADFTRKGIDVLNNPTGFFMMVESGKIDWACHANDAGATIHDTLAFERAINKAIEFYNEHADETLIIVTADHETGGMTLGYAATGYSTFFDKITYQKKSYEAFDKELAIYINSKTAASAKLADLLPAVKESFGLVVSTDKDAGSRAGMVLTDYEVQRLGDALAQSMIPAKERKLTEAEKVMYGGYEPFSVTLTHILNNKAGIGWKSYSHTGIPVPVFAMGVGQNLFTGYYDNTDIFKKISSILKVKE